jgi:hypothetical protein
MESTRRDLERALQPDDARRTLTERLLSIKYSERTLVAELAAIARVDLDDYRKERRPYLTSEEVKTMIRHGFTVGAHSHDHPYYAELPLSDQIAQTATSMDMLASRFGCKLKAFAFPHSDAGVDPQFFKEVFSSGLLQVSFGTGGMVRHFHPKNLERVNMEKTAAPAGAILARQCARTAYRNGRAAMGI